MRELRGKGWRVLGYFVWMLGAGVRARRPAVRQSRRLLLCRRRGAVRDRRVAIGAWAVRTRREQPRLRIAFSVAISAVFLGFAVRGVHWDETLAALGAAQLSLGRC